MDEFEVRASARYIPMSARKVRLVLDQVRGKPADEALHLLEFMPKRAAHYVYKVLRSAIANAEENHGLAPEDLYVARIYADEGPTLKRGRAGPRGRFKPILKRTCHITVVLKEYEYV